MTPSDSAGQKIAE